MAIINTKFIGLGAAGNKAMMLALESGIVEKDDLILVNSAEDDIPDNYEGEVVILPGNTGGTGKNRKTSEAQAKALLSKKQISFESILGVGKDKEDPGHYTRVVMACSSDGGSGSGSTPVFAAHIINTLHIPVTLFVFVGVPTDMTSYKNTIEFMTAIGEIENLNYAIIDNSQFMNSKNDFDSSRIESDANKHFCMMLSIFCGNTIVLGGSQNMDKRDQEILTRTPGYVLVTSHRFDTKVKNAQQVEDEVKATLDDSLKGPDPSVLGFENLGVIITASSPDELKYLPSVTGVIRNKFGSWVKMYNHRQIGSETIIDVIMTGVKPPTDWLESMYRSYKELSAEISRERSTITGGKNKYVLDDDSALKDPFQSEEF